MAKRTCAIMQPAYLPWIGFYDLIDQADEFVFLDTAQFCKQTWQQRNRIRYGNSYDWLSVPVHKRFGQMIIDVMINKDISFAQEHLDKMRSSYQYAKWFKNYYELVEGAIFANRSVARLCDFTIALTVSIGGMLGMNPQSVTGLPYHRSSQMDISGGRSERLVNICKALKCDRYLSPFGAKDYLLEDKKVFDEAGIEVLLQNYVHPEYDQGPHEFLSHMSVVDLLFNEGPWALEVIRSGRKPSLKLEA